jgi:hypothetical protein
MRGAFLNGEYSIYGWRTFFLWTFALKSTIPFIAASPWSVWLAVRARLAPAAGRAPGGLLPLTPLLALFSVYWAFSIASHLNIGHRHLLPVYPVLFILTGALGPWFARPLGWRALLVGGLLAWHVGESVWIAPHYLAYFNELAGGPPNGPPPPGRQLARLGPGPARAQGLARRNRARARTPTSPISAPASPATTGCR